MTTMTFRNYGELTEALSDAARARLNGAEVNGADISTSIGRSNQSCSAYLESSIEVIDEDGDEVLHSCKLRYSDHGDRYGSDVSIEINRFVRTIETEDGEYLHIEIWAEDFEAMVEAGIERVMAKLGEKL